MIKAFILWSTDSHSPNRTGQARAYQPQYQSYTCKDESTPCHITDVLNGNIETKQEKKRKVKLQDFEHFTYQ